MCLSTVDEKLKYRRRRIGYKLMLQDLEGGLRGRYYSSAVMEIGKTYTDRKRNLIHDSLGRAPDYKPGYHIYLDKDVATKIARNSMECLSIVKVRFGNVVATGKQTRDTIIVARRMTILKVL